MSGGGCGSGFVHQQTYFMGDPRPWFERMNLSKEINRELSHRHKEPAFIELAKIVSLFLQSDLVITV